jgi:hypothetical protein
MKKLLILCAAALLHAIPATAADQEVGYPENNARIALTIPDGWVSREKDGILQAAASEELDTMLIVRPLKAKKTEGSQAIAEVKNSLSELYGERIDYSELEEGGSDHMGVYVLNAKAVVRTADATDVNAIINSLILTFPDNDDLVLAQILTTEAGLEKNGEDIGKLVQSIQRAE